MDQQIAKKNGPMATEEFGASESGESAHGGMAEIITLNTARNRKPAPTPNDAPSVPIDEHIGRHLKAIYDDVLNQPIPERFLDLLTQLGGESSGDEDA